MPDNPEVATIDSNPLIILSERFSRLRQDLLESVSKRNEFLLKYRNPNEENEEEGEDVYTIIKDDIIRTTVIRQLSALLIFMEDDEDLVPDLHQLLLALVDLDNGRTVKWLRRNYKKGQPPPPVKESLVHGHCAAVMDWLMEAGGKSRKEAAKFIVTHGGVRRHIETSGKARRAAHPWRTVANWRERATRPDAPVPERAAFDQMYKLIRSRNSGNRDDASREALARNMLRLLNNRHSRF